MEEDQDFIKVSIISILQRMEINLEDVQEKMEKDIFAEADSECQ